MLTDHATRSAHRARAIGNPFFDAFGTQVDLGLVSVDRQQAQQAASLVQQDFAFLQEAWHSWQPGPMGRVNQMLLTEEPFVAPPSTMPLVRISKELEARSGGLFNPAIKLDFDSIAKGHALDLAIEHLRDLGIKSALVQAGGEVRVIGDRSGQPWRITLRRPSGSGVLAIVPMRGDESLVTKADYDRNFVFKGEIDHAIIDPRTGSPARGTRSVTVLHQDATTAAATALFGAGPTEWEAVATGMGIRYVLLIDAEGTLHMNQWMAERIELVDSSARVAPAHESAEGQEAADP